MSDAQPPPARKKRGPGAYVTPEMRREIVRLRIKDGLSYAEIGERVGVSVLTALKYCREPLKRFRARLVADADSILADHLLALLAVHDRLYAAVMRLRVVESEEIRTDDEGTDETIRRKRESDVAGHAPPGSATGRFDWEEVREETNRVGLMKVVKLRRKHGDLALIPMLIAVQREIQRLTGLDISRPQSIQTLVVTGESRPRGSLIPRETLYAAIGDLAARGIGAALPAAIPYATPPSAPQDPPGDG